MFAAMSDAKRSAVPVRGRLVPTVTLFGNREEKTICLSPNINHLT